MDRTSSSKGPSRDERQLAQLKIISRLMGHELNAQNGPRITLSREELTEIHTLLDLYIESAVRKRGPAPRAASELEVQAVPARVN